MYEPSIEKSDYERLSDELRRSAGPLEYLVDTIQDGIELEEFRSSKAGKLIIGSAVQSMRNSIEAILDPNLPTDETMRAVFELRVRHRLLCFIDETIKGGRTATSRMIAGENAEPTEENTL